MLNDKKFNIRFMGMCFAGFVIIALLFIVLSPFMGFPPSAVNAQAATIEDNTPIVLIPSPIAIELTDWLEKNNRDLYSEHIWITDFIYIVEQKHGKRVAEEVWQIWQEHSDRRTEEKREALLQKIP